VTLEPPSLTIRPGRTGGMGGAGAYPDTAQGSSVIRMRQGTVPRRQASTGRGFGTGFSHTVEFSRNVAGMLFGDSPAVPASCHRRSGGTVPRAFQARQRLPTCPESVLLVEHHPPRRHLHTEAPPCAPTIWASGRPPNSRRTNPVGVRRPPVFRCRRRWRRSGEVLGPEEFPCLQPEDGSTVFDSVSTCYRRLDTSNHNGSSGVTRCNGRRRRGIPRRPWPSGRRRLQQDRGPPADGEQAPVQLGRCPALLDRADLLAVESDRPLADQPPGLAP
jgi:hypothetical protein